MPYGTLHCVVHFKFDVVVVVVVGSLLRLTPVDVVLKCRQSLIQGGLGVTVYLLYYLHLWYFVVPVC